MSINPAIRLHRAEAQAAKARAQLAGDTKYTGQLCAKCGDSIRYSATGACVECTFRRGAVLRAKRPTLAGLQDKLRQALEAEARAWARVAELEDQYEPRHDHDLESAT